MQTFAAELQKASQASPIIDFHSFFSFFLQISHAEGCVSPRVGFKKLCLTAEHYTLV